jgi:hypothetical protein
MHSFCILCYELFLIHSTLCSKTVEFFIADTRECSGGLDVFKTKLIYIYSTDNMMFKKLNHLAWAQRKSPRRCKLEEVMPGKTGHRTARNNRVLLQLGISLELNLKLKSTTFFILVEAVTGKSCKLPKAAKTHRNNVFLTAESI